MTQANNVAIESSQINSSGVLTPAGGGTGLSTVGTNGQVLTSNGTTLSWSNPSSVAVSSFQTSLNGLTPSTSTTGAVTLAGTLGVASGGTGLTSLTSGYIPYGGGTGAFNSQANFQILNNNLQLGASTNGWYGSAYALQLAGGSIWSFNVSGNVQIEIGNNYYQSNLGTYNYLSSVSTPATIYRQLSDGSHSFFAAPSGTAGGAITFTRAFTISSNSAIGVGSSPSYGTSGQFLQSQGSSAAPIWSAPVYTATYLIVAGGGSGGSYGGGGGGAGGYLTGTTSFVGGTVYSVTVGAGASAVTGSTQGLTGSNSVALGLTALGGGGGGSRNGTVSGLSGGSGGGGTYNGVAGGSGTSGQGNRGGNGNSGNGTGGGGGGAGAQGADVAGPQGWNGGVGLANSITGSSVYYAGGGGSGSDTAPASSGGLGGGGAGFSGNGNGTAGTANTGGGGGGGGSPGGYTSGAGGSGVVIFSVPTFAYSGVTTGSPTITTSGSNTIIKFTASGSYTA
jgi:hypothetical protein